jgi:hypothetical protein
LASVSVQSGLLFPLAPTRIGIGGYITDETGLTGKFDVDWTFFNQFHQGGRFYESLLKNQQQRFLQDLGLRLILTNKISTEYFQISKVN